MTRYLIQTVISGFLCTCFMVGCKKEVGKGFVKLEGQEHKGEFGAEMATQGNILAVGAPKAEKVIIYEKDSQEEKWKIKTTLTPNSTNSGSNFGRSVAMTDQFLAVGAPGDENDSAKPGAVYLFERQGDRWKPKARLTAREGPNNDEFGYAISLAQHTLAVGAEREDSQVEDSGAVYLFEENQGTWKQTARLEPPKTCYRGLFGTAIDIKDDYLAIGTANGISSGTSVAYIYKRDKTGWVLDGTLVSKDPGSGPFGAISLHGNTVAVGSPIMGIPGLGYPGDIYLFSKETGVWEQKDKFSVKDRSGVQCFGVSVNLDEDRLVVGSLGNAWLFGKINGRWQELKKFFDNSDEDGFGMTVTQHQGRVFVGATGEEEGSDPGAVYIFH